MLNLYLVLSLLVVGYVIGQYLERRHYRSIEARELAYISLITTSSKRPLGEITEPSRVELVEGACVISIDYFKQFVASLRQLFGGSLRSYETLVDRARREAVLRLKEQCLDAGQVINLRLETSSISKGQKGQVGAVEVHAYATAIYFPPATVSGEHGL
ncbi:MAG: YbjQ family protein [Congregibacter sp.]